jgi:hypothetical protein
MFRVFLGFCLGVAASYYGLPMVDAAMGNVDRVIQGAMPSTRDTEYPSTTLNASPAIDRYKRDAITVNNINAQDIDMVMSYLNSHPLDDRSPTMVVSLLSALMELEPGIRQDIRRMLHNGMKNRDALAIIEKYQRLQG